jgi:TetR/AcrR family transcriptional repressor of bet genes
MSASFRRAPGFERRSDMIEATLDCIADLGIRATTVRAVAARAGVSNGLIRHHFASKDNLIVAAYRHTITLMTQPALEALETPGASPHQRLSLFVAASLGGPVADPRMMSVWATFISQIRVDQAIAREHHEGYLNFRQAAETVIAEILRAEGRSPSAAELERLGIVVNALIDGLWVEGCLAENFNETEQIDLALRAVEALLRVKLPEPI